MLWNQSAVFIYLFKKSVFEVKFWKLPFGEKKKNWITWNFQKQQVNYYKK